MYAAMGNIFDESGQRDFYGAISPVE